MLVDEGKALLGQLKPKVWLEVLDSVSDAAAEMFVLCSLTLRSRGMSPR
jgi:hypothetical protein